MPGLKNLSPAAATLLLLAGFTLAVWLRVLIGGPGPAGSPWAGLVFAACLTGLGLAAGTRTRISGRGVSLGLLGGLALCLPALIVLLLHGGHRYSLHGYFRWAAVVTIVATAEEYFLRGTLFDAVRRWLGVPAAVLVPAIAFAGLHVPLYGWHVLPLDLAVGVWLGALRLTGQSWTTPGIAHILADLLAWWLF